MEAIDGAVRARDWRRLVGLCEDYELGMYGTHQVPPHEFSAVFLLAYLLSGDL